MGAARPLVGHRLSTITGPVRDMLIDELANQPFVKLRKCDALLCHPERDMRDGTDVPANRGALPGRVVTGVPCVRCWHHRNLRGRCSDAETAGTHRRPARTRRLFTSVARGLPAPPKAVARAPMLTTNRPLALPGLCFGNMSDGKKTTNDKCNDPAPQHRGEPGGRGKRAALERAHAPTTA